MMRIASGIGRRGWRHIPAVAGLLAAAAVACTGAVGGEASAQALTSPGSSAPEDLRDRLDLLDAELAAVRARLGGATGDNSGLAAAVSGSPLNRLAAEVARLTAVVEEMQNRQRRIAEEAARRFSDIEFRLTELEGGDIGILEPVPPLGGVGTEPETETETVPQPTLGAPAVPAPEPSGTDLAVVSPGEQADLDLASQDIIQGRYDQGEERLRSFLSDYPASPLRSDAYYWLGESQFVRGNYAQAARTFLAGYNADRAGPRAPHNLYRLGMTLGRLGQTREACLTLREVPAQFPAAPDGLVDRANAEARALDCG